MALDYQPGQSAPHTAGPQPQQGKPDLQALYDAACAALDELGDALGLEKMDYSDDENAENGAEQNPAEQENEPQSDEEVIAGIPPRPKSSTPAPMGGNGLGIPAKSAPSVTTGGAQHLTPMQPGGRPGARPTGGAVNPFSKRPIVGR